MLNMSLYSLDDHDHVDEPADHALAQGQGQGQKSVKTGGEKRLQVPGADGIEKQLQVPGADGIDDGASSCRGSCMSSISAATSNRSKKSTVSSGSAMTMLDSDAI